jgi:hypothetical protein
MYDMIVYLSSQDDSNAESVKRGYRQGRASKPLLERFDLSKKRARLLKVHTLDGRRTKLLSEIGTIANRSVHLG